jgi:hypothetical protein
MRVVCVSKGNMFMGTQHVIVLFSTWSIMLKVFCPVCVFLLFSILTPPTKTLNALSATDVNAVQTFADMNVWWDSLQLCVFCLPVLC